MNMATLTELGRSYLDELKKNPSDLNIFNIATRINGLVWKGTAQKLEPKDKRVIVDAIFDGADEDLKSKKRKLEESVGI